MAWSSVDACKVLFKGMNLIYKLQFFVEMKYSIAKKELM
jgi:hypothetical protein